MRRGSRQRVDERLNLGIRISRCALTSSEKGDRILGMEREKIQDSDDIYQATEVVVRECLWGDYHLTPQELADRIQTSDDMEFKTWIFSKVVDNSSHPSRYIRLFFTPETTQLLLDRSLKTARDRRAQRLRMIERNIFGKGEELMEYAWQR
jgi:hypothetical protein